MTNEHRRYERLAVGHVVGGLDQVDAARFRSHLVDCRSCRNRVAELRGIASDLLATEREERAAKAGNGRTDLAERVEEEAPPRPRDVASPRSWPWRVVVIGLLPLVVLGALAWAVWIRAEAQLQAAALQTSNDALRTIAEGQVLPLEVEAGAADLEGVVATSGDDVVVDLSGVPALGPDEVVVAVLVDAEDEVVVRGTRLSGSMLDSDWLFDVLDRGVVDATAVVVRVERLDGDEFVPVTDLARATLP